MIDYEVASARLSYDPKTGVLIWKKSGKEAGCYHKGKGYRVVSVNNRQYKAHRLAWLLHYGRWPNPYIDHINGVRDDNRIANLRETTTRGNGMNRKEHRAGKLPGTDRADGARWKARIEINGKSKYLGCFNSESEAHKAYLSACRALEER
jgi:hypothetical protein